MVKKHLASCGSIGFSGRRVGTTYSYTPRSVLAIMGNPWFMFRNAECERYCREEWAKPEPTAGEYFEVTNEPVPEDYGFCTRVDGELRNCSLVKYEREPYCGGQLHRIGDTDLYQILEKRSDYHWHHVGRTLKINETGLAIRGED